MSNDNQLFSRMQESSTTNIVGTTTALTLAGAVPGFQAFVTKITDGKKTPLAWWEVNPVTKVPNGVWETATDAIFTASGTSVSRGTFRDSSTGSAIASSSGEKRVAQSLPAELLNQVGWNYAAVAPTSADITALVNTFHTADLSGLTGGRSLIMPASAGVNIGDRVRVTVKTTHATAGRELIIKGNTSQSINYGSSATEWSRIWQPGEYVELVYNEVNNWIVNIDGRIPDITFMGRAADQTGIPNDVAAFVQVVMDTFISGSGHGWFSGGGYFKAPRAGRYAAYGRAYMSGVTTLMNFAVAQNSLIGTTDGVASDSNPTGSAAQISHAAVMNCAIGDTIAAICNGTSGGTISVQFGTGLNGLKVIEQL